jgi:hypothetical protein
MDNDLLSKSKLIDWLEEKIESYFLAYHNSYSDYDQGREASYHEVIESVRSGLFDPDPTPSPTIKPGDKVYHSRFNLKGTVKRLSQSGKRAYVIWNYGYMPSYVELKSLEVVESD